MTIASEEISHFPDLASLVSSKRTHTGGSGEVSALRRSKRIRGGARNSEDVDSISDKENWYASKNLAPRARPAKVFAELLIDLPTDCSDYEFESDDFAPICLGKVYGEFLTRMNDPKNMHYNFSVYQDTSSPP